MKYTLSCFFLAGIPRYNLQLVALGNALFLVADIHQRVGCVVDRDFDLCQHDNIMQFLKFGAELSMMTSSFSAISKTSSVRLRFDDLVNQGKQVWVKNYIHGG